MVFFNDPGYPLPDDNDDWHEPKYAILTEDYGIYGKHYCGQVVEIKDVPPVIAPNEGEKVEVLTHDGWTTWMPTRILAPCDKPANWDEGLQKAWDSR